MECYELIQFSKQTKFSDRLERELSLQEATALLEYSSILSKWSERMSLVSSPEIERIVHEHILDCWAAFQIVPRETNYLDVGSGAGLPGIVFSILAPSSHVILLEPRAKRVQFLKEVRRLLGLDNIKIVESRLEDWNESFEEVSVVERAVGMEKEIYRELAGKTNSFTFSALVSLDWINPMPEIASTTGNYALPNGTQHRVVCFT